MQDDESSPVGVAIMPEAKRTDKRARDLRVFIGSRKLADLE
jgi:hypothetical protein